MSAATLYTYPDNFRAQKVLIAAQYSKFKLQVDNDFVFGETNKSDGFLKKFPVGKVPALETKDKEYIFESNAIAHFVSNEQLRGKDVLSQTEILQWVNFSDSEIVPSACAWLFPILGYIQSSPAVIGKARDDLQRILKVLNGHLLTKTYLVGERITLADISVFCSLLGLYQHVLAPGIRSNYKNVNRWFVTLMNQPEFKTVLGNVMLCEKARTAKQSVGKDEEVPATKNVEKSSKQQHKKDKKKEKGDEKEVEELPDETELALAAEPVSKDPFQEFPKGTFVMDSFKKVYSNESEGVSIDYFWQNFDAENYSIWYCEYLFPSELTLTFMSCNLIGGMYQRLDKMRKNAFGSVCLFGEDNNSTISGIWIWRGHQLAFQLSQDWQIDYESYSWKKLDPADPETKKVVNEYLAWAGDFGGKKFNQGKIFK